MGNFENDASVRHHHDAVVQRFREREEAVREEVRDQLKAPGQCLIAYTMAFPIYDNISPSG